MINRRVENKGKLVGLFIGLKAALDTVDWKVLIRELREREVKGE